MAITQPEEDEPAGSPSAGDAEAAAGLYARHERAVTGLAASYLGAGDHADLVRRSFERTLAATRPADAGDSFCARWFVTLRRLVAGGGAGGAGGTGNLAYRLEELPSGLRDLPGPAVVPARRATALGAFGMVPGRMQAVLWQTEVEARPPPELAAPLGMTPTAVMALAAQARARLRHAVLEVHRGEPVRPGCEPHRPRLAGHVGDDTDASARTAVAAHIEGCPSCTALAGELADIPRAFLQALVPLFGRADTVAGDDGRPSREARAASGRPGLAGRGRRERRWGGGSATPVPTRPRPAASGGARRRGGRAGTRFPAPVGTRTGAGVAAAAVAVVLAIATVVTTGPPRGPGSAGDLAGSSSVRAGPAPPPTRPAAPGRADPLAPGLAPGSTARGSALPHPVPAGAAPSVPTPVAPAPDATAGSPSPAQPVATTPPQPVPAPAPPEPPPPPAPVEPDLQVAAVPSVGSVAWSAADGQVRITLVNGTDRPTGFLVLTLTALGGSFVSGQPSGCAMGLGAVATGMCALVPLAPGASATVHVPVRVTGAGQSAQVTLCAASVLRLDCDTALLAPTVVALG